MEGKKNTVSIADELFGRKESKSSAASASSGYFNSVFPPNPHVKAKNSSHSDLYWTLNNQRDGKSQANASKNNHQSTYSYKDGKPAAAYQTESTESPYFGSSVHYGARDFYGSPPSKYVVESPVTYKNDDNDDSIATRGDWWQGSLYY